MSDAMLRDSTSPPFILVDPCIQFDSSGAWATTRVVGNTIEEVEVLLTVEGELVVGPDKEHAAVLGWNAYGQLRDAVQEAMKRPFTLVIDARSEHPLLLQPDGHLKAWTIPPLANLVGARHYETTHHTVVFELCLPNHFAIWIVLHLALGYDAWNVLGR